MSSALGRPVRVATLTAWALLAIAVIAGSALRLAPCLARPDFEFAFDGRYHERLTLEVANTGRLAALDPLCNAPHGRRTADHLPTGLYVAGALGQRALAAAGVADPRWALALLLALAGGLVAVPAWIGARAVFQSRAAAAAAALIAAFLPAHVLRTQGFTLRYDAPGTLLAALHVALALAALAEQRPWRRRALAVASALALALALATWRVTLLVLALELASGAVRFVMRGAEPAARDLWWVIVLVATPALLPVRYLAAHGFFVSTPWLFAAGLAVLLALPARAGGSAVVRGALLALVAAAAWMLGRGAGGSDYAGIGAMLAARLHPGTAPGPDAALMLTVQELQGMAPARLLAGSQVFSLLGALTLLAPLIFWWASRQNAPQRASRVERERGKPRRVGASAGASAEAASRAATMPASGANGACGATGAAALQLAVLAAGLMIATLLFRRSDVLLAPVVAIVTGGLLARLWTACAAAARAAAWCVGAAALVAIALGVSDGLGSGPSHVSRNEADAIEFVRLHAAPGAVVLADWDAGYEIQARVARPTVIDGLMESTENRGRIVELYRALMDPGPARLLAMCERYGARWLVLPPGSAIYALALVTGDPLAPVLASGAGVPRGPLTDHLIVHLIEGGVAYPALRRAAEFGGYTVFELAPRDSAGAGAR